MNKEFHIISSGVSIITNAQKAGLIPREKQIRNELSILDELKKFTIVSGPAATDIYNNSADEIDRLSIYGLVDVEKDELNRIYRIKIINKGKLILEQLEH